MEVADTMIGVFQKDVSQYDFFEKIKVISIKKSYNKKYVKNESPKMAVFNTHAYIYRQLMIFRFKLHSYLLI